MLRSLRVGLSALALAVGAALPVSAAQNTPAAAPGGAAAGDFAKPRKVLEVPKGYQKVTVGGNTALVEPNDVKWVTDALTAVKAPEAPAGAPSKRVEQLKKTRDVLIDTMVKDLALPNDADVRALVDTQLPAKLNELERTRPPLFFIVTTPQKFRDLVKAGWGEGQFRYVPLTDSVNVSDAIPFTPGKDMDDTAWPTLYDEAQKDEKARVDGVAGMIQTMNANILGTAAQQAGPLVFGQFSTFVQDKVVEPLKLKDDQKWFGIGLTNYLAAKYSAMVLDARKDDVVKSIVAEPEQVLISMRTVNLLSPGEEKTMRAEVRPLYDIARLRKSTLIFAIWTEQAGGDLNAIPKVLTALRAKLPEDGKALLAVIKEQSKVDLDRFFGIVPPPPAK